MSVVERSYCALHLEKDMGRIDSHLKEELLRWRDDLRQAEERSSTALEITKIKERRVGVFVTFSGDVQNLTDRGLTIGSVAHGIATGEIALSGVETLAEVEGVVSITLGQPMKPELDQSVPEIKVPLVWNASPSYKGRGVIVGIIDTGIDIFHGSFRKTDLTRTRILSIWVQDPTPPKVGDPPLPPPPSRLGFNYGAEFLPTHIEVALKQDVEHPGTATFGHLDGGGHGTHVAGIAAGDGSQKDGCSSPGKYIGVAPEADIVVVAYTHLQPRVLDAVRYIFKLADSQNKPVVVNISSGWSLGPHDESGDLEKGIDQLLQGTTGKVVVKSAGNEGNSHRHARKTVTQNGSVAFQFDINLRTDDSSSFRVSNAIRRDEVPDKLDIWYDGAAALDFKLIPPDPGSTPIQIVPAGSSPPPFDVGSRKHRVTVSSDATPNNNGKKNISFTIDGSRENPISGGRWTIELKEKAGNPATIDIWAEREDNDVYPQFIEGDRRRENTITSPGYARNVITVGAYDAVRSFFGLLDAAGTLAEFSSYGLPATARPAGARIKPDIAAPGVSITAPNSNVSRLDPCCKCCVDYYIPKPGTSMAAPHVTGVVALMLEKNRNLTFKEIREFIQLGARFDGIPDDELPRDLDPETGILQNHIWGSGKLNADLSVSAIPLSSVHSSSGGSGEGNLSGRGGATPFRPTIWPADFPSVTNRFLAWESGLAGYPAFQLCAALVSTHFDEVLRLINTNRRIATVWHRNGGPLLVRDIFSHNADSVPIIPDEIAGHNISALLDRLMKILVRFSSEALRADIFRYRDFILAVPGADLNNLDKRILEWNSL
jgi:subtilisin family serine protease